MSWVTAEAGSTSTESISLQSAEVTPEMREPPDMREIRFRISTPFFTLSVAPSSSAEMDSWLAAVKANATSPNGFGSPFTQHDGVNGKWFIDGKDTFRAMYQAIASAKHTIYITDWFLTPEVFLVRDQGDLHACASSTPPVVPVLSPDKRLDNLLAQKAREGVQVYVLPWSETKVAMELNSSHAKAVLEGIVATDTSNSNTQAAVAGESGTRAASKSGGNIRVILHPLTWPMKWSHHQKTLVVDHSVAFVGGLDMCLGRYDTCTHPCTDLGSVPLFPGKDYYNPAVAELTDVDDVWSNSVVREQVPRMPWHDVHLMLDGEAANDVALNFITRWNHHRAQVAPSYPILRPRRVAKRPTGSLRCTVLRSIGPWSAGVETERSIQNAYLETIARAERFIYIENQYFISCVEPPDTNATPNNTPPATPSPLSSSSSSSLSSPSLPSSSSSSNSNSNDVIRNRIAQVLLDKICDHYQRKKPLRVVIVLPWHPEGSHEAPTTRAIMSYQYRTWIRGANSLLRTIVRRCPGIEPEIDDWVSFYSLRTVGRLTTENKLACEQIYVHTKLLVVDDRFVILGSANINDRSMLGNRDSEIAVLLEDTDLLRIPIVSQNDLAADPTLTPQCFTVGRFAHELRTSLWLEHLGLDGSATARVVDPLTDTSFHGCWRKTAIANTVILRKVFPDGARVVPFSQPAAEALEGLAGHLVLLDDELVSEAMCAAAMNDVSVRLAGAEVFI